jgi:outer membrane protein OmpA-like peptidoglycan-associated protein
LVTQLAARRAGIVNVTRVFGFLSRTGWFIERNSRFRYQSMVMRVLRILIAVLLTAATPVVAQVTVDLHALEPLPNRPAASQPARPRVQADPATPVVVTRVAPTPQIAPAPTPQPAMPEAVPQTASINPIAPPEPPATAPPPPPVSDTSETKAAPTTTGLRLAFAPDQSDLSPESSTTIKQLTASAPPGDETVFNVQAYAPGKKDDPSTARRISLSRAMAVRSALVADGIPSARIFVRALGDQYGDGPPDRVDIAVTAPTNNSTAGAR